MISLLSGNNEIAKLNFLKFTKSKYPNEGIHVFNNDKFTPASIMDVAFSSNMFGDNKKLILITPKKVDQLEFGKEFLEDIVTNDDVQIIIDISKFRKTQKQIKTLLKYAKLSDFSQKGTSDVF